MKYIKFYWNRSTKVGYDVEEVLVEKNFDTRLRIIRDYSKLRTFDIYLEESEVIEVGECGYFKYRGTELIPSNGKNWIYKDYPKGELNLTSEDEAYINNKLAGSFSYGGDLLDCIKTFITKLSITKYEPWVKFEYDDTKLDDEAAFSLLLINVARAGLEGR